MRLDGKVVALTGAAGGLGRACAERYATEGAAIVCIGLDDAVVDLAGDLRDRGKSAVGVVADVSNEDGNAQAVDTAVREFGRLDVFHANAAIQVMGRVTDTTLDGWESMQQSNLRGPFLGARAAIPALRDAGGGSILFTASVLGIVGDADLPAYGAMKGGLRALCRAIAAAEGVDNIRCNTICPADIETPMVEDYFNNQADPATARAEVLARYPLGR